MARASALLLGAALALAGCSTGSAGKGGDARQGGNGAITVKSVEAAQKALGQRVRVEGTAQNAKISAVVMVEGTPIYCLDRESWPDDLTGKPVTIEGTLEQTSELQAKTSPSGEVSQGTAGPILVLRKCTGP
jgi:hypothetical protein